jgi:sRNA-binding carbon storage regulator CsrA
MTKRQCVYTAVKTLELEVIGWMRDGARDGFPAPRDAVDIARNNVIELAMAESDEEAVELAKAQARRKQERA